MTNVLDGLLGRVQDPALRSEIEAEVARLRDTKDFGLVFDRHVPENVRLYSQAVTRGARVQAREGTSDQTWLVRRVDNKNAVIVDADGAEDIQPVAELVVIREFGTPIYPGLKRLGQIKRGGEAPFHTVINGENFHALQALLYAYEERVDCIYIDPPYNSGARDWKYNNDYVDGNDAYRHSKWLSFIEKRLVLAKRLLKPDSALVVTIDEKEVHHLGMLLEQLFPNAVRQLATIVINPLGQARKQELARVEEYAFFVFLGSAAPASVPDDLLTEQKTTTRSNKVRWEWLIRGGTHSLRRERPNLFFPVFVDPRKRRIVSIGDALPLTAKRTAQKTPKGLVAVWPLNTNGNEGNWRCSPDYLRELVAQGYAKVGAYDGNLDRYSILYLGKAQIRRIASGEIIIAGRDENNAVEVRSAVDQQKLVTAKTVWNRLPHRAGEYGSALVKKLLPGRDFPFPKSLYAVRDTLQVASGGNPDALIVDFFAGSGTTAHATMLLNQEDGGRRRSICVTNNEVSSEEAERLSGEGAAPGEPRWEACGIFEHITRPRIEAALVGQDLTGHGLVGDYLSGTRMADGFRANMEFLEMTYLDPNEVSRGKAFAALAPLLWMRVGSTGPMIDKEKRPFAAPKGGRYAVLFDINHWQDFAEALRGRQELTHAFVVTDSLAQYQQVVAELPPTLAISMLYEDYMRTFENNLGQAE